MCLIILLQLTSIDSIIDHWLALKLYNIFMTTITVSVILYFLSTSYIQLLHLQFSYTCPNQKCLSSLASWLLQLFPYLLCTLHTSKQMSWSYTVPFVITSLPLLYMKQYLFCAGRLVSQFWVRLGCCKKNQ